MGKINVDKVNGTGAIHTGRKIGVRRAETDLPTATAKAPEADKLEFSGRASEVGQLVEQLKGLPDIRQEKVNRLRGEIAAGTYNPSSEDIADAILKDERS